MSLTTTQYVLTSMNIFNPTSDQAMRFDQLRQAAEAAVISYLKWDPTLVTGQVDYLDGNGQNVLPIRRPWVQQVTELKLDPLGAYGENPNSFGSTTVLTIGTDWALRLDGNVGSTNYSKSAALVCLRGNQLWMPSDLFFGGMIGFGGYGNAKLSLPATPVWPAYPGCVKITYDYGFATIPSDIQGAVAMTVAIFNNSMQYGGILTNEALARYSYGLSLEPHFGSVRQLLSRWRDSAL